MRIEVNALHPEPRKIERAAKALADGEVIAYPTDTVYALGCSMLEKRAVDRLYHLTGKDEGQHLSLVCADLSNIARYAVVENRHYRLLKRILPGPYTFILNATKEVPRMLLSRRKTIGIRVPNHAVPLALVAAHGAPLISTSATHQGEEPLNDAGDVVARFKGVELVLDGGYTGLTPSTVVDLTGAEPLVVREGAGPSDVFFG